MSLLFRIGSSKRQILVCMFWLVNNILCTLCYSNVLTILCCSWIVIPEAYQNIIFKLLVLNPETLAKTLFNVYLTNRFHFSVRLYCNRPQMTSWRAKNKKVRHETKSSALTLCSSQAMTSSVIYGSTDARKNEIYLFYGIKSQNKDLRKHFAQIHKPLDVDRVVIYACVL